MRYYILSDRSYALNCKSLLFHKICLRLWAVIFGKHILFEICNFPFVYEKLYYQKAVQGRAGGPSPGPSADGPGPHCGGGGHSAGDHRPFGGSPRPLGCLKRRLS